MLEYRNREKNEVGCFNLNEMLRYLEADIRQISEKKPNIRN